MRFRALLLPWALALGTCVEASRVVERPNPTLVSGGHSWAQ